MNLYFLVEGMCTETTVYPKWLSYLVPKLTRVDKCELAKKNNYYILSSNGYPSIISTHIPNAIKEVNEYQQYNYLVVCLDAEDMDIDEKYIEITSFLFNKGLSLNSAKLKIIIQNRCFETWFLGNTMIYSRKPIDKDLKIYTSHFNVSTNDPELMLKNGNPKFKTHAQFHSTYLKALFKEKRIEYSKSKPAYVSEEYYLKELIKRTKKYHLITFKCFLDFCTIINKYPL
ncbi:MAG: hypothetical protein SFH39_15105 [Candidatus Magnetobacterium sp. LHC-1]